MTSNVEQGSVFASLPARNMGLAGRATYGFDGRYFGEFNFGYNGTERFADNERFGFFPSAGAAWYVSNEEFFTQFKKTISKLKIKATYGLVGNDQIGRHRKGWRSGSIGRSVWPADPRDRGGRTD